jgi:hypothetical protein
MSSNKRRKKLGRIQAAEQYILRTFLGRSHYEKRAVVYEAKYARSVSEFARKHAKPAYDALVKRITEHKEEVKSLRKRT